MMSLTISPFRLGTESLQRHAIAPLLFTSCVYVYDFLSFFTVSCEAMSHEMKTPFAAKGQGF